MFCKLDEPSKIDRHFTVGEVLGHKIANGFGAAFIRYIKYGGSPNDAFLVEQNQPVVMTALMLAVYRLHHPSYLRFLVSVGADINYRICQAGYFDWKAHPTTALELAMSPLFTCRCDILRILQTLGAKS